MATSRILSSDINSKHGSMTALVCSTTYGLWKMTAELLRLGADPNQVSAAYLRLHFWPLCHAL